MIEKDELEAAFDSRLAERECPPVLYHYTSVGGFMGIIATRQIWASHAAFMNDPGELRHADEYIYRTVEGIRGDATGVGAIVVDRFLRNHPAERIYRDFDIFIACFSEHADSLPQWQAYADNGKGYAIGLDATYGGRQKYPVPCGEYGNYVVDTYEVEYSVPKLVKELQEYLRKLLARTAVFENSGADRKALEFQAYRSLRIRAAHESIRHKHSAFEHEKEWRMVVFGPDLRRHHRPCRGVPAPYFPLDLAEAEDRLPIQEVRVGPGHVSTGTAVAAVMGSSDLLRDKCMRTDWGNMVTVSEIPYQP